MSIVGTGLHSDVGVSEPIRTEVVLTAHQRGRCVSAGK